MNIKGSLILFVTIGIILIVFLVNKNRTEHFVDVDKEKFSSHFSSTQCQTTNDMCNNFMNCCVNDDNTACKNVSLVACQKYKLKCENQCKKKQIDDNGKKETNLDKCNETCRQVQKNCCKRLAKLN